jgi:hypothetical protein
MFISQETGLPVVGCDVTVNQLNRQARQSQKRLDLAAGKTNAEVRGIDENGMPTLVNPDRLFPNLGPSSGTSAKPQAAQGPLAVSSDSSLSLAGADGADYSNAAEGAAADGATESP